MHVEIQGERVAFYEDIHVPPVLNTAHVLTRSAINQLARVVPDKRPWWIGAMHDLVRRLPRYTTTLPSYRTPSPPPMASPPSSLPRAPSSPRRPVAYSIDMNDEFDVDLLSGEF
jgi:hypothetical protein